MYMLIGFISDLKMEKKRGILGIEPRASHIFEFRTQSENHTTRPHAQLFYISFVMIDNDIPLIFTSLTTINNLISWVVGWLSFPMGSGLVGIWVKVKK